MTTSLLRRTGAFAAIAVALSFSLAACGSDDSSSDTTPADSTNPTAAAPFGAACSAVPADGAGSFNGMAAVPVATAASANPLLSTLVAAVTKAGLVDTLNKGDATWTVFAPVNSAFAKIKDADLNAILADKAQLTAILTHHVLPERLAPDALAGEHTTVNGDMLTVTGSGENFTIDGSAKVICGSIQTSNATVYLIDSVLSPTK